MPNAQPKPTASFTSSPLQTLATRAWTRTRTTQRTSIHTSTSRGSTSRSARTTATTRTPLRATSWKGTRATVAEGTATGATLTRTQRRNFNWTWSRRSEPGKATSGAGAEGKSGASQQTKQQQKPENLSLSGRLRKLSREYGWAAAGVYLALSVSDFPFCFLLVKWVGTDRIAEIEHWVTSRVSKVIPDGVKQQWHEWRGTGNDEPEVEEHLGADGQASGADAKAVGWGVEQAQQRNKANASLATQLALAYAIHKSFIFVRVPLTAAITPKVVKVLRSWGWQIGKRKPKVNRPSA
ncbi:hypothetical protein BD289DRAFT_367883 [Coniella lustricola]|uniref:DUF1279 domain-containing protein n=1 Tax=Coniella lustricola TaxID=2025994 RepID=A0A2T3A8X0_9PEZI|nr:hypothetical protein BD289DRAFT_367883 [Coniella lustricola]